MTAYELHDGVTQYVVGAKMILDSVSNRLAEGDVLRVKELETADASLGRAIQEARRIISGLRPLIIDEQGISGAIDYLINEHEQRSGLHVDFTNNLAFARCDPLLENTVFRIVQEALNNVVRHAEVKETDIHLFQSHTKLHVEICDNGVGFDPAKIPAVRFGLRGIMERVRLLGGKAAIESAPGKGTKIIAELPFLLK